MPSVMAIGCQWMVGIASIAAQAIECLPFLNCATCVSWHWPHVSGVGIVAFAASVAVMWAEPWQVSHSIPTSWCLLCFQSETTLGVTVLWQATHCCPMLEVCAECGPAIATEVKQIRNRTAKEESSTRRDMTTSGQSKSGPRGTSKPRQKQANRSMTKVTYHGAVAPRLVHHCSRILVSEVAGLCRFIQAEG